MQGWGDNKGGSENNIHYHYPEGYELSPRSWPDWNDGEAGTKKREGPGEGGRGGARRKLARGNEERDGIAGRAKASGIKLKENGVCSPLFFWVLVEGLHYIYWM